MAIVFTKLSDTRVQVNTDTGVIGFASQNVNVFEHPYEEAIVISGLCNPAAAISGIGGGLIVKVSDVQTPSVTTKRDLVLELITNYFV